jgi:hypothetical protein
MKTGSCLCGDVRFELRGVLDGPTGLPLAGNLFVADAGDYYEVAGGTYRRDRA